MTVTLNVLVVYLLNRYIDFLLEENLLCQNNLDPLSHKLSFKVCGLDLTFINYTKKNQEKSIIREFKVCEEAQLSKLVLSDSIRLKFSLSLKTNMFVTLVSYCGLFRAPAYW